MAEQNVIKDIQIQRGINDQIKGFKDTVIDHNQSFLDSYDPFAKLLEDPIPGRMPMRLLETMVLKPDAANMMRDGIRFLAFSQIAAMGQPWKSLVRQETSNKPEEMYLRDAAIGTIPIKNSGEDVDFVNRSFEGSTKVTNYLRRMGVIVTGDDIKFDRIGVIRQIATDLGRSAVVTEDDAFFTSITTTGNFTRNSTTGDNDVGANTQTLTFNALQLDLALACISTSKDRKSGNYLNYHADTIIIGPRMEYPVKQMLLSPILSRYGGTGAIEVRGMGTTNPYTGTFNRILVHPKFSASYAWALVDSTAYSYVWQVVDPWQILQENQIEASEAWLVRNAIRYVIMGYFGNGLVDDRAWFYSDSTTAPTVS